MTHYTTTNANINSSSYRADHRPQPTTCQVCYSAPAVRCVTHRDERDGTYVTANVCDYCAGKAGK